MADGIGSIVASIFGVLPNTSFSQNVGLVTVTKIVNRFVIMTGAIFLILCGFCPKLKCIIFSYATVSIRWSSSYNVLYDTCKWDTISI